MMRRWRYVEVIETVHYKVPVFGPSMEHAEQEAIIKVESTRNRDRWVFKVSGRDVGVVSLSKNSGEWQ